MSCPDNLASSLGGVLIASLCQHPIILIYESGIWARAAEVAAPIWKLCVLMDLVSRWSLDSREFSNAEKIWRVKPLPFSVTKRGPTQLPQAARYGSMPNVGHIRPISSSQVNIYFPAGWVGFWSLSKHGIRPAVDWDIWEGQIGRYIIIIWTRDCKFTNLHEPKKAMQHAAHSMIFLYDWGSCDST